jgi:hypothetical protein
MIDFFEMVPSISISSVIYDAPLLTTIGCLWLQSRLFWSFHIRYWFDSTFVFPSSSSRLSGILYSSVLKIQQ